MSFLFHRLLTFNWIYLPSLTLLCSSEYSSHSLSPHLLWRWHTSNLWQATKPFFRQNVMDFCNYSFVGLCITISSVRSVPEKQRTQFERLKISIWAVEDEVEWKEMRNNYYVTGQNTKNGRKQCRNCNWKMKVKTIPPFHP